jgi:hypothetical protein
MATTKVPVELSSTPGIVDNSNATAITINSSEQVGIGTASPVKLLHLAAGSPVIRLEDSDGGYGEVSGSNGNIRLRADEGDSQSSSFMSFDVDSTEKIRLTSTGLGIGTTSPSYTLDVNTSGNASAFRVSNSTNGQDLNCTLTNSGTTAGDDSLFDITTQDGAGDPKVRFTIAGNENYEIGIDNTDSDKLKISQGSALGTDDRITVQGANVGIGMSGPSGMHSGVQRLVVGDGAGNEGMAIWSGADSSGMLGFARANAGNADAYDGNIEYEQGGRSMRFAINAGSETMRATSGGLLIGTTNTGHDVNVLGHYIDEAGYCVHRRSSAASLYLNRWNSEGHIQYFYFDTTIVGSISVSDDATAFNTSSDGRLKDVTGEAKGLEVINKLNPVSFNWKSSGKAAQGMIAQEVLEVMPECVIKGEEHEYYSMDYSKLVTPLVKAVQEQQEQIEKLKQQINKLKEEK